MKRSQHAARISRTARTARAPRTSGIPRIGHLAARFAGSLARRTVGDEDRAWVATLLSPDEKVLWEALAPIDQVESVAVARRARRGLCALGTIAPSDVDRWLAAALLHDVGKTRASLGRMGRSVATVVGWWLADPAAWAARPGGGFVARIGCYLDHAAMGADRIAETGGRREAAAWARHHHDPRAWSDPGFAAVSGVPLTVARVLAGADGEPVGRAPLPAVNGGESG